MELTKGLPAPALRRNVDELKPRLNRPKSSGGREHKLGATARSFAILEHVASSRAPVDVLDIIASVKLPKATAYRLVDWFVTQGYLAREPGRRRLIVGPKLANLAFGALSSSMRHDTPHVVLQRLVHTLNETCNIGTLLNGEVVYLDRVEAEHWPLRLHYTSGSRVPLHCSAIGKLFLALAASPRRKRLAAKSGTAAISQIAPSPTAPGSMPSFVRFERIRFLSIGKSISSVSSAWPFR